AVLRILWYKVNILVGMGEHNLKAVIGYTQRCRYSHERFLFHLMDFSIHCREGYEVSKMLEFDGVDHCRTFDIINITITLLQFYVPQLSDWHQGCGTRHLLNLKF